VRQVSRKRDKRRGRGGEEVDEEYRGIMRLLAHVALLLLAGWKKADTQAIGVLRDVSRPQLGLWK